MRGIDPRGPTLNRSALAWAVFLSALALRLLHLFFSSRYNPLSDDLTLDAAIYDRWAKAIVWGGEPEPTRLMQSPLYPWFLSIVYRLFGPSLTAVRYMQALLGTASCALIMLITKNLFQSRESGYIAGAAAALYLPFIFFEGVLISAALIVFLNVLFIALMIGGNRPPGVFRLLITGIVFGISVMSNPVAVLIFPFALLHLALGYGKRTIDDKPEKPVAGSRRFGRFVKWTAALTIGVLIGVAPLTIRNTRLTGEFTPLTTGGGINFYIGNNPKANGFYAIPAYGDKLLGGTPEEQWQNMHKTASGEEGRKLTPNEVSGFWLRKGIDYIDEYRNEWKVLLWRKFLFFWNDYERANVESFSFHRRFPGILRLPLLTFGLVVPLGVLGIFLTRNRWRNLWLLYGAVLAYLLVALAFYVISRYRLPVVAALMPFAGAAVVELFNLVRNRRIGEFICMAAALLLLYYFMNITVAVDTPNGISNNFTRLGKAYTARGETEEAIKAYREALNKNPLNTEARRELRRLTKKR